MNKKSSTRAKDERSSSAAIVSVLRQAIITISGTGTIRSVNPACMDMFGYSERELIGSDVKILMPSPDRERHATYVRDHQKDPASRVIAMDRIVRARKRDGTYFSVFVQVVETTDDGLPIYVGIIHDLTAQKLATSAAARYGRIIEDSANEIFVFDAETLKFSMVNGAARANLGYSWDELCAMTPLDLKPDFTLAQFQELLRPLRLGKLDILRFDTVHLRNDGSKYPVQISLHFARHESPPVFFAIIQDRTIQRDMEAKLRHAEKLESIGRLTGGLAHDFNNLLMVIQGSAELLKMSARDEDLSLVDSILESTDRGSRLTHRLLAFSRQQPLQPRVVGVRSLVSRNVELLRRTLGATIEVQVHIPDDIWDILIDPSQLENAILNLAINARDAMADGGTLTLSCRNVFDTELPQGWTEEEPGGSDFVCVEVTDTGIGMTPEVIDQAFEPFFTTKDVGSGSGLGLSMVYGFAKQSGGVAQITSRVGSGTTIELFLPRSKRPSTTEESGGPEEPKQEPQGSGQQVLLVEDDHAVRALTYRILQQLGYQVVSAEDADSARRIIASGGDIDIILCDFVLPGGVSGPELIASIRADNPRLPVVFMSGYADLQTTHESIMGLDAPFLSKPFEKIDLARLLHAELSGSQERPQASSSTP